MKSVRTEVNYLLPDSGSQKQYPISNIQHSRSNRSLLSSSSLTFFIGLILLSLFYPVSSTFANPLKISGLVRDKNNHQPLMNANIIVQETVHGTASRSDGKFELAGLEPGTYRLKVSMIGYKSVERQVTLKAGQVVSLTFDLESTVLKMQPIAVFGKAWDGPQERNIIEKPNLESPGLEIITSTVTRRQIKKQGSKTLIEAMKFIPGALIESRGRKVKQFFSVRGQRYPYPDYAINGAWQREFLETPYFFAATDIERIEIIRSSAALLTGLSGLAGVINIVTREYNQPETMVELEAGSFGTARTHISHGAKVGNVAYATGVGFRHTDGPDQKHAVEEMSNFYGSVHWYPTKKLDIRFNLFHLNGRRELALAEPPAAARFQTELWTFEPFRTTLSNLKLFYQPTQRLSTQLQLYYTDRNPTAIAEDFENHQITRTSEPDYEWGINLIQSVSWFTNNVLRFGGLYNHWLAPNGKRFYSGKRCDLETYSAVVVDEHRFGRLTVDAGLRWARTYLDEYGAFNINGSSKGFNNVVPVQDEWEPSIFQTSLGARYNLTSQLSLYSNLAAGGINPRRGSLDVNLQTPQNERRLKLDAGLRIRYPALGQFALTTFLVEQKNALVLSGQTAEKDNRIMELYQNRDQDQAGIEIEARLSPVYNLVEAFFNFTAMRSRAKIADEMVRNKELPQLIGSGGIYTQFHGFALTLLGKYVSSFESIRFVANSAANPATPKPLGDFLTLDLTAGWTLGQRPQIRTYLEFRNLTNKKYSTVVGYPDFGRRFTLGVRLGGN